MVLTDLLICINICICYVHALRKKHEVNDYECVLKEYNRNSKSSLNYMCPVLKVFYVITQNLKESTHILKSSTTHSEIFRRKNRTFDWNKNRLLISFLYIPIHIKCTTYPTHTHTLTLHSKSTNKILLVWQRWFFFSLLYNFIAYLPTYMCGRSWQQPWRRRCVMHFCTQRNHAPVPRMSARHKIQNVFGIKKKNMRV